MIDKTVEERLKIDESHLNDEIMRQPGEYAYYTRKYADKKKDVELLKLELNVLVAERDSFLREDFTSKGEKFTEPKITNAINKESKAVELKKKIINAECEYDTLKGIVSAWDQRKDCLVSISANKREELKQRIGIPE